MTYELGERSEALGAGVIAPLIVGGSMHLVRPFGARLALSLESWRLGDDALRSRIQLARLRRARTLIPIDRIDDPSAVEWRLSAALNDLLQATNHELSGPLSRGRHNELLEHVIQICTSLPGPASLGDAVLRHASFGRVLELRRDDTTVRWWTGSASFRGREPSTRLLSWPELRRVSIDKQEVPFGDLSADLSHVDAAAFERATALWLSLSPLTDLSTADRDRPGFAWTAHTLSLLSRRAGRIVAARALARASGGARAAVRQARDQLQPRSKGRRWADNLIRLVDALLDQDDLERMARYGRGRAGASEG